MRRLLCAVFVLAACARPESGAAGAQKYVGTWEGRSYASPSDTGVPFRTIMAVAPDGSLRGTLMFTSVTAGPVPIRTRKLSGSKIEQEYGPYHSPRTDSDVRSSSTAQLKGDSLTGTFEMRPAEGGDVILKGTFTAKRVTP